MTISVKAPPLMLISSTPPSNPLSVMKRCLKVIVAEAVCTYTEGETRYRSEIEATSFVNTALGAVLEEVVTVVQGAPEPVPLVLQPDGRAGDVTPSKFCLTPPE